MAAVIFFDMDGVLADFVGGSLKAHGKTLPIGECDWDFMRKVGFSHGGDPAFWRPLERPEFWAGLDPLPDGLDLYHRCVAAFGPDRVAILSSGLCPGSVDGKRDWLRAHLPDFDIKRAVFATAKELCASPARVLVDDHDRNADAFRAAGGWPVLVPRPWNPRKPLACPDSGRFDPASVFGEVREAAVNATWTIKH